MYERRPLEGALLDCVDGRLAHLEANQVWRVLQFGRVARTQVSNRRARRARRPHNESVGRNHADWRLADAERSQLRNEAEHFRLPSGKFIAYRASSSSRSKLAAQTGQIEILEVWNALKRLRNYNRNSVEFERQRREKRKIESADRHFVDLQERISSSILAFFSF